MDILCCHCESIGLAHLTLRNRLCDLLLLLCNQYQTYPAEYFKHAWIHWWFAWIFFINSSRRSIGTTSHSSLKMILFCTISFSLKKTYLWIRRGISLTQPNLAWLRSPRSQVPCSPMYNSVICLFLFWLQHRYLYALWSSSRTFAACERKPYQMDQPGHLWFPAECNIIFTFHSLCNIYWTHFGACKGPFTLYDWRIRLFILMYPIQSLESSGTIATLASE